jgi:hypothetical protein
VKGLHAASVAVTEHAECSTISLIRDVAPQPVNASLAKTRMTGRRASMLNQDAWCCGIGSRSEQAPAYLCAANVTYANEMLMNNYLFTLLMTGLKVHIAK